MTADENVRDAEFMRRYVEEARKTAWRDGFEAGRRAALGDPQPDTRQCPATRDDGYRCQAFTAHDKHVDLIGRMW